ncbi:MAG: polyprenyl diphosphate synthase, partial [Pseudomonadales bacterium]
MSPRREDLPRHVAIIMDGNGRWAQARGLTRYLGHRAGADAVRRIVEAAGDAGVEFLTLYAFSSDNWKRPRDEISAIMRLLDRYLQSETQRLAEEGVRVTVVGRRDRLRPRTRALIKRTEEATRSGTRMRLRVAIDYSARETIIRAAKLAEGRDVTREEFAELLARAMHCEPDYPEIDLLIRTSGEMRLSDFFLWESAYAELYFTDTLWPDFEDKDLHAAFDEYAHRERRFGEAQSPRLVSVLLTTPGEMSRFVLGVSHQRPRDL